ncbi:MULTISPECIES: dioxygenase family protein [unclassified Sphingomonas]|uniref:dioxygenase family protein n=1 Tax=unclassified Sphingomonas TaxID=196159 RepID=UPI000700C742|nr:MULTISPECIES: dioxygenase [unclassified Sphingomonas]KQX22630.1 hypothetical protein ASD17_04860 [Sphingomonas sp. Root1294]KQY67891.1 hypothetical protein ASD39_08270 [Sphingomonas sp. Root50]KRB88815.1 hypothetical protein ASE22_20615 [Sphingomonas sp. Root720]
MLKIDEQTITAAVIEAMSGTTDPRFKQIMTSLITHLHGFVRQIEPTEQEWFQAIDFLTATGQMCSDIRQEFILLSDTLGVTTLVDAINHRYPSGATPNSVLGPFFFEGRAEFPMGADIADGVDGALLFVEGRVLDVNGAPVADATIDVWHSDADGHYDMMLPDFRDGHTTMRGLFRTGTDGHFRFRTVMPASYPIPDDGPVGALMRGTARSNMRPGHMHFLIAAPGFERLTTMLFVAGDPHLASDPVFGVKQELIVDYRQQESGRLPDASLTDAPFLTLSHDFTLATAREHRGTAA